MRKIYIPGKSLLVLSCFNRLGERKWWRSKSWKIPFIQPKCLCRSVFSSEREYSNFADIFTSFLSTPEENLFIFSDFISYSFFSIPSKKQNRTELSERTKVIVKKKEKKKQKTNKNCSQRSRTDREGTQYLVIN